MAVAKFKQDFSPVTAGGGGRMAGGGSVSRMYRPGNFNEPGLSRQFTAGQYLKFQRRLRSGPGALWRGLAAGGAYVAYEFDQYWVTTPYQPNAMGLPLPRFSGFTLQCDMTATPDCSSIFGPPPGPVKWSGDVGYPVRPCFDPGYVCNNWGILANAPTDLGVQSQISMHLERLVGSSSVRAIWTAPVAIPVPAPLGFTFPLDGLVEWKAPEPDFALAPRPMRRPWLDVDPSGRPHPLADHVPALELRFPARRATASAGARRRAVRHYQRPDRARKGRGGLPAGMVRALMLFHAATEMKDFIDAMYDAVPRWRRRGVGNGWFERLEAIASNWDAFLEPEVAQDAVENLLENEVEDRLIGRLFGASWGLGRGRLQDQYASTSWVDAAGNDPYGGRDTVMGLDGSPTEVFPWNQ